MENRRIESRLLCAELVEVIWQDKSGSKVRRIANLEDISLTGACLQMEYSVPRGTSIVISYGDGQLTGIARYCLFRDMGYFVGVEFSDCKWSTKHFRPKHLLDPHHMVEQAVRRARTLNSNGQGQGQC